MARSLERIRELRDAEPNRDTIRFKIFTLFLIQPRQIGPHAGRLRYLNYEDPKDYNIFRSAVSRDLEDVLNAAGCAQRDEIMHVYYGAWDIFEGTTSDIPTYVAPEYVPPKYEFRPWGPEYR